MSLIESARAVASWYERVARPEFFEKYEPVRAEELSEAARRIEKFAELAKEEPAICVLGHAGVGKSTLLNALVGDTVVPQGGVGPLTALATVVRWAERPRFQAEYQQGRQLYRMEFGLTQNFKASQRDPAVAELDDAELRQHLSDEDLEATTESDIEVYRRQARQIVRGNANADVPMPYLLDALRHVRGAGPVFGTQLSAEDVARLERVRVALQHARDGRPYVRELRGPQDKTAFAADVKEHASGALAPLIAKLEVEWNASLLDNGLVLVDLPGMGVASDRFKEEADRWVKERARAVMLVVDRNGVTTESAALLRQSRFLESLCHTAFDPDAPPVHLIVAATKLEQPATAEWQDARARAREAGERPTRTWLEHFEEVRERMRQVIRAQVETMFREVVDEGSDSMRAERQALVEKLLAGLDIHCVDALEHQKLRWEDEEAPSRFKESSQSGVEDLAAKLKSIATNRRATLHERLEEAAEQLYSRASATLELHRARWEGDDRVAAEVEKLRTLLEEAVQPLQRELYSRQGSFRSFLKDTVPALIDGKVSEACQDGRNSIRRSLSRMRDWHWTTLAASVRRDGVYDGARTVNLPAEFAAKFEAPIALVWSKYVLAEIRKRTRELGEDYQELVGQLVLKVEEAGATAQSRIISGIRAEIAADTQGLAEVGRDAVAELSEKVKAELHKKLEASIRRRCRKFIEDGENQGGGVKGRILDMFDELAEASTEAAKESATQILSDNFAAVEKEIRRVFNRHGDPLERARDSIVDRKEAAERRKDAKQRRETLESIERVLKSDPRGGNSKQAA